MEEVAPSGDPAAARSPSVLVGIEQGPPDARATRTTSLIRYTLSICSIHAVQVLGSPQYLVSPAGYVEILRLLRMVVEWLLPKRLLTEWLLAPASIALHTVAELLRLSIEVSACC
jgi:hypothetical protein